MPIILDSNIRYKICDYLPIAELIDCRYLSRDWKKTVDLFMINKLIKEYGIQHVFLNHFESCHFCDLIHRKGNVKIKYGPSHTWGIKEYLVCNNCEKIHTW